MASELTKKIRQTLQATTPPGYTESPGPVYLGDSPSLDSLHRGGVWNTKALSDLQLAQLQWGATPSQVGAVAGLRGMFRPGTTGQDGGAGSTYPWEARQSLWELNGFLNTATGNLETSEPLVSWPSYPGLGIDCTLYHNSQTTFNGPLGHGWSLNYDARIYSTDTDYTVRWGDGTTMVYSFSDSAGVWNPPLGIHDKLVVRPTHDFTITKPDQTKYVFRWPDGRLQAIHGRHGDTVVITQGAYGPTAVTDPTGRALTFSYTAGGLVHQITDPDNRIWTLVYNGVNQLTSVQYPSLGGTIYQHGYGYDTANRITSKTDFNGKTSTFTYTSGPSGGDGLGSSTTPGGHKTTYAYSASACTMTLPGGQQSVYNYSSGRLASSVDASGFSTAVTYDGSNNVATFADKRGKIWRFSWDARGNPLTLTDPLSHQTVLSYNSTNDLLTARDPLLNTTTFNVNAYGDLTSVVDPLGRTVVTNTFDTATGELLTSADALGNQYTVGYDMYGNVLSITDPLGHEVQQTVDFLGNVTATTDAVGNTELYNLDAWSRVVSVQHPDGASVSAATDPEGHVNVITDELAHATALYYDDDGNLTSAIDANGNTESCLFNANGWLTRSTNGLGYSRSYGHTATGQLNTVTLPDLEGLTFNYDANGQLSQYVTPASEAINYSYDDAGRRTLVSFPSGPSTAFTYDAADRLKTMADSMGTSTLTYDNDSEVTQIASPQGTVNYTYDSDGREHTVQRVGDANPQTFTYDAASRLTSLVNQFTQGTLFEYDNGDRLSKETLGNGTWETFTYDSRSRLIGLAKHKADNSTFRNESYSYDPVSNLITKWVDNVETDFTYDALGQLQTETSPGYSALYSYDANGNRLTKTINGATDVYTYDSADKLQYVSSPSGDKSYFYDGDGRTRTIASSAGNTTFSYDYEGHVTGISYPNSTTNSFNNNGLGTRVKRTDVASGTRTFLHDGLGPADGVLFDGTVSFTPGVSERTSAGLDRWYNADGLGSLTDITDAFGNTTNRTWDAFGNQKTGTNFIYLHGYGESGNYQEDKDSGLKLCGLRYYDSTTGRFLTPDPVGFGDNWYDYCRNHPAGLLDATGLSPRDPNEDGSFAEDWAEIVEQTEMQELENPGLQPGGGLEMDEGAVYMTGMPRSALDRATVEGVSALSETSPGLGDICADSILEDSPLSLYRAVGPREIEALGRSGGIAVPSPSYDFEKPFHLAAEDSMRFGEMGRSTLFPNGYQIWRWPNPLGLGQEGPPMDGLRTWMVPNEELPRLGVGRRLR